MNTKEISLPNEKYFKVTPKGLIIKEVHYSERLNDRMNIDKIRAFAEAKS